jgi:hypothetical protein
LPAIAILAHRKIFETRFFNFLKYKQMKKTMKNAAIALVTLIAISTGFTASANTPGTVPAPQMKMIGRTSSDPMFQLKLNNQEFGKFIIVVKDEFGYILHTEVLSGVNVQRTYQLNQDELSGVGVSFEIVNEKNETTVFTITNSNTVVAQTAVAKLK